MKKYVASFVALALISPPSWAVGHINPGTFPRHKQDNIHRPTTAQVSHFGTLKAALASGSTGPKNVAVILVQFPASSLISGSNLITDPANITNRFASMAAYYDEVSYHKISLTFKYFGPNTSSVGGDATAQAAGVYTLSQPEQYYGCGDEGVGCGSTPTPVPGVVPRANGDYLIRDALTVALAGHGGTPTTSGFDAVVVVHAGNGDETDQHGTLGDIWSIFYRDDPGSPVISTAGAGFDEGDVVPDTESEGLSPLGVMCHEFGHELGLPDLYNTESLGGTSVVGNWELMDSGPFDGNGDNPSHMGAWDKQFLGWATPQLIGSQGNITMGTVENTPTGMVRLNVPNTGSQEYFLVEYRSTTAAAPVAYDKSIPGTGLLIWHIDDAITSTRGIAATDPSLINTVNSGSPHYGVSIVTHDGSTIGSNRGDAGNVFGNGSIFIPPTSNNFAGQPSGIVIVNIGGIGTSQASAVVAAFAVSPGQSILRAVNYPNPAGKGYMHPSGEGHTTIQFQLSRPAQDYSINIYNLSADLVKKIGKDDIGLNVTRSGDDKWVYEYTWDLTNGSGRHVAPGTYLYLIRADGETKNGKMVIIR